MDWMRHAVLESRMDWMRMRSQSMASSKNHESAVQEGAKFSMRTRTIHGIHGIRLGAESPKESAGCPGHPQNEPQGVPAEFRSWFDDRVNQFDRLRAEFPGPRFGSGR